jgi:hypothetical protein
VAEAKIEELAKVVSGENAAIWAYGFLMAFLNEEDYQTGFRTFNQHRNARDEARLKLRALNQTPPRPLPNYQLPFAVNNAQNAKKLAAYIEDRLCGLYAKLAGVEVGAEQIAAFEKSLQSAQLSYRWSGETKSFPGSVD